MREEAFVEARRRVQKLGEAEVASHLDRFEPAMVRFGGLARAILERLDRE